jgi:oligoribonuclease NrnB/cAMP/cGMP phosphodiesterase (DHH superfamily)
MNTNNNINIKSGMLNDVTDISVYYHADCTDGLLSAACVYLWHSGKSDLIAEKHTTLISTIPIEYVAYKYGMIPKKLGKGDLLILVDFSFDLQTIESLLETGVKICLIDHHEPRVLELNHLIQEKKIWGILDTEYSGCALAFAFFNAYTNSEKATRYFNIKYYLDHLPRMIRHAQDRDLWHRKMLGTDEIMLGFYETIFTIEEAAATVNMNSLDQKFVKLFDRGTISREIRQSFLNEALENKFLLTFKGKTSGNTYTIPCVNLPQSFRSEACNILFTETNHIGAAITILSEGMCKVSLRSKNDVVINTIAIDMGGGGHPQAAGFEAHISCFNFDETNNKFDDLVYEIHDFCSTLDSMLNDNDAEEIAQDLMDRVDLINKGES